MTTKQNAIAIAGAFLVGAALAWAVKPARSVQSEPFNEDRINQCERWAVIGPAGKFASECTKAEQDFVLRHLEATRN